MQTQYLVLDFDNLPYNQIEMAQAAITSHPQVCLAYRTPSNSGIKVLFKLHQPLDDKKIYHDLGKAYGTTFANQYNLLAYLDMQTFDVTRASFICPDFLAYFNPQAKPINWQEHTRHSLLMSKYADDIAAEGNEVQPNEPSQEVYKAILSKLKPNTPKPSPNTPELTENMLHIKQLLEQICPEYDMALTEWRPIQYGMQLRITHQNGHLGECNLFYGKKGYSIVRGMKADLNHALTEVLEKLLWQCIHSQYTNQPYQLEQEQLLRKI